MWNRFTFAIFYLSFWYHFTFLILQIQIVICEPTYSSSYPPHPLLLHVLVAHVPIIFMPRSQARLSFIGHSMGGLVIRKALEVSNVIWEYMVEISRIYCGSIHGSAKNV